MPTKVNVEIRPRATKVTLTFEFESLYAAFIRSLSKVSDPSLQAFAKMLVVADARAEASDIKNGIQRGKADVRDVV